MLVKSIFVQMCKAYSVYDCKLTVTSLGILLDLYHNVRINLILYSVYASAHRKHTQIPPDRVRGSHITQY